MSFLTRQLIPDDAQACVEIRREALERDPFAFLSSPDDDRALSLAFVREGLANSSQATFGAFAPQLVGVAGVSRDVKIKAAHKAHLWGLYVTPAFRGRGIGRSLMTGALGFARQLPGVAEIHLSVAGNGKAAIRLYETLGFVAWGTEPRGICVGGEFVALHHMILEFGTRAA